MTERLEHGLDRWRWTLPFGPGGIAPFVQPDHGGRGVAWHLGPGAGIGRALGAIAGLMRRIAGIVSPPDLERGAERGRGPMPLARPAARPAAFAWPRLLR